MLKSTDELVLHCYPGLIALITAKSGDVQNVMTCGWHSYLSANPPIYGIAVGKERFTYDLIKNSGSFAVNFVPAEFIDYIEAAGKLTGADGDKLERIGMKWKEGETVTSPILEDAYVAYECKVIDIRPYGDHDWIVGNITKFHRDETKFENGLPNFKNVQLPLFLGQSNYLIADEETNVKKSEFKLDE